MKRYGDVEDKTSIKDRKKAAIAVLMAAALLFICMTGCKGFYKEKAFLSAILMNVSVNKEQMKDLETDLKNDYLGDPDAGCIECARCDGLDNLQRTVNIRIVARDMDFLVADLTAKQLFPSKPEEESPYENLEELLPEELWELVEPQVIYSDSPFRDKEPIAVYVGNTKLNGALKMSNGGSFLYVFRNAPHIDEVISLLTYLFTEE